MTITASNYAAQARRAVESVLSSPMCMGLDRKRERDKTLHVRDLMDRAQHFALPDGAELFEDNLRGLAGQKLRLPYPVVTLEYFVPQADAYSSVSSLYVPKIVVVAAEFTGEQLGTGNADDIVIQVFSIYEVRGVWTPNPVGFLIHGGWDEYANTTRISPLHAEYSTRPAVVGKIFPWFDFISEESVRRVGAERTEIEFTHNISSEVYAVLSFCEAMQCTNVGTETIAGATAAVNAKRTRNGKLPILETKVLTVVVPGQAGARIDSSGQRTGEIRQHLRRGHIRRLAGDRRIWVNSCVVGNPNVGRIEKQYRVQSGGSAA